VTLQTLDRVIHWPGIMLGGSGNLTTQVVATLNAAGEYAAYVFRAKEAMTISHVGWFGTASGSPTADVRVETVDAATGLPTGTLWAANTNLVTGTVTNNAWRLDALTASASIAAGDWVAVKWVYQSGTSVAVAEIPGPGLGTMARPYKVVNTGTPTRSAITSAIMAAIGSSATDFYKLEGIIAVNATNASTFTTTNSEARGVRFQVPFPCRCVGIARYNVSSSLGDHNVVLADDSGTELSSSSTTFEGDVFAAAAGKSMQFFDNPVTLSANTWYRAFVEATSATATHFPRYSIPSSDYSETKPAANFESCIRVSGTWTDTATDVPIVDILIDQLDDGAGSGGGGISRARGFGGFA
jgi:hypothetical protein